MTPVFFAQNITTGDVLGAREWHTLQNAIEANWAPLDNVELYHRNGFNYYVSTLMPCPAGMAVYIPGRLLSKHWQTFDYLTLAPEFRARLMELAGV